MEINCIMITAQVIGLAAMIVTVLSLQCRSNQNFYRCQTAGYAERYPRTITPELDLCAE